METTNLETKEIKQEIKPEVKRGRPLKNKEIINQKEIKKIDIISETARVDIWKVRHKDPNKRYIWGRQSSDVEMNLFAQKGYVPAIGNETIVGNPFVANQDSAGKVKVRGDRILMCCPKHIYEARKKHELSRYQKADVAAKNDARRLSGEKGVKVIPEASQETRRESMEE